MDLSLQTLAGVLARADDRLRTGAHEPDRLWPTGFDLLDRHLNGGFRNGDLVLLSGPQGLGKTTWALQVARNIARIGRSVLFLSFEHDPQSLLIRLVALEAGLRGGPEAPDVERVRTAFESADGRTGSLQERLEDTHGGPAAVDAVRDYAENLVLHRSTGSSTTLRVIADAVAEVQRDTGQTPLVIVDYLQKVRVPDAPREEDDRVTLVVEGLKDLALEHDLPVLAVVAADKSALGVGQRMRVKDLRGSSALAYEADTVLIFNNKFNIVARHHLVYNVGSAERFHHWAVLTIEKHRNGRDGIDLEFRKRFGQARYDVDGQAVAEQLVDDRVFLE